MTTTTTKIPAPLIRNDHETELNGCTTWTNGLGIQVWGEKEPKDGWCPLAINAPMKTVQYVVRYSVFGEQRLAKFTVRMYGSTGKARAAAFRFVETLSKNH